MAEPIGTALDAVITKAQAVLQDVRLVRRDERPARSLIDFEGRHQTGPDLPCLWAGGVAARQVLRCVWHAPGGAHASP